MQEENRRSFVKKIGTASALAGFINWNPGTKGANERILG